MTVSEHINAVIPTLKPSDRVDFALDLLNDFHLDCLPLIENGSFKGMVSMDNLERNEPSQLLSELRLEYELAIINEHAHFLEVLRLLGENQCTLIAVVDNERVYRGAITSSDIIDQLAKTFTIQGEGSLVVLEMYFRDYSLSDISRLIEAEGILLTGLFLDYHPRDNAKIFLTLKMNSKDSMRALSALERFGYAVVGEYDINKPTNLEKERYDNLLRFLNV